MKLLLAISAVICITTHCLAAGALETAAPHLLLQHIDFIPSHEALGQLNRPASMLSASRRIEVLGPRKDPLTVCSSAVVSDDGDILTAGHCLEPCLVENDAYRRVDGFDQADPKKVADAKCYLSIDGKTVPAHVLAVNRCSEQEELSIPQAMKSCPGISYALVKVEPSALDQGACFETSDQHLDVGQALAGLGFPDRSFRDAFRAGAQDSRGGGRQYVSFGTVLKPAPHCLRMLDKGGGEVPFPDEAATELLLHKAETGDLIQTSVDFVYGDSGGPLIDQANGRLVGLGSFFLKLNDKYTECSGSSFFSSIPAIMADIKKQYPDLDMAREFGCRSSSFLRANDQTN
jgi:hypothetical protein